MCLMVLDKVVSCLQFCFLDDLLKKLSDSGVGCYWGYLFAGTVCYADNIVLLTLCPFALRILLKRTPLV